MAEPYIPNPIAAVEIKLLIPATLRDAIEKTRESIGGRDAAEVITKALTFYIHVINLERAGDKLLIDSPGLKLVQLKVSE